MKHDLDETILAAMMCHEPVAIVEGQDDVKFYANISSLENISVDVRAVETIDGYTEGCEHVIEAMNYANSLFQNDERLRKYVIGIIDRDVRQYRNILPVIDNLLILNYYSYETHLITDNTIKKIVEQLTKAPAKLINQEVIDYLKTDYNSQNNELYYFSLEALKGICDTSYQADINYGDKAGIVIGNSKSYKWNLISPKKQMLDAYALTMNINKDDIKYIAKGKWYVLSWCDYLNRKTKELVDLCGNPLPRCIYCEAGEAEKCLWKQSSKFQVSMIESMLYTCQFIDLEEVKYIADYMKAKFMDDGI